PTVATRPPPVHGGSPLLPVHVPGTFAVLRNGSLIPRRARVEVRIGPVIANQQLRALAENAEGAGAYRKLADHLRAALLALVERPSRLAQIQVATPSIVADDGAPPAAEPPKHHPASHRAHRRA